MLTVSWRLRKLSPKQKTIIISHKNHLSRQSLDCREDGSKAWWQMENQNQPGRNGGLLAHTAQALSHQFTHHNYVMTTPKCGWKAMSKPPHDGLTAAWKPVGDSITVHSLPGNLESVCSYPREGVGNQRQVICSSALLPGPFHLLFIVFIFQINQDGK